jgi:tRNA pseudouridine55 synthase
VTRTVKRRIDGVLLLDKPPGITSQRAVTRVKQLYQAAKAGHTGTLDPAAIGLLPVCFGEATKFSHLLLDADKAYRATVRLGTTTTTGDLEGEVVRTAEVLADAAQITAAVEQFRGEISQVPPMFSALKHAGKPLYEYARAGESIHREPRTVRIHGIHVIEVRGNDVDIAVRCSKGTYIRVLAEDLGQALGCGATLASLTRTGVGEFELGQAVSLEALDAMAPEQRLAQLKPVDILIQALPRLDLDALQRERVSKGQHLELPLGSLSGLARLYGPETEFLGVGEVSPPGRVEPRRMLAADQQ